MSYLINVKNGELVTYTSKKLKSGERVKVAFDRCKESINTDSRCNLVNAIECKASNAKKWEKENKYANSCIEINNNEFYI
tara:strand:- start:797 stop:1036 length:240 start_codon:yes stop_codon:yes gene_type:complete